MKRAVQIDIQGEAAGQKIEQQNHGELYVLENQLVLRYAETDPSLGNTKTTMKIGAGEIKIIRHGDVESEQTYRSGQMTRGTLRTAGAVLSLEKQTHDIQLEMNEHGGSVSWSYDMIVNGDPNGTYHLKVTATVIA
jgi:uncharacterized beta-barrel protein YwiB (DUF1934 family)